MMASLVHRNDNVTICGAPLIPAVALPSSTLSMVVHRNQAAMTWRHCMILVSTTEHHEAMWMGPVLRVDSMMLESPTTTYPSHASRVQYVAHMASN